MRLHFAAMEWTAPPTAADRAPWLKSWLLASRRGPRRFIGLDFDGTLAPIVDRPEDAAAIPEARAVLPKLVEHHAVALISGRSVVELKAQCDVPGLHYAGCHGMELISPGSDPEAPFVKVAGEPGLFRLDRALVHRPALEALGAEARRQLASVEGSFVEDKGLAVAIHRRLVPDEQRSAFDAAIVRLGEQFATLHRKDGKSVHEFLPPVAWHKGEAFAWLAERLADQGGGFYAGDDTTDEDAFAVLEGADNTIELPIDAGLGVLVGPPRPSRASVRVEDPAALVAVLTQLIPRE
ncbi:MAG: trehalose-phosphatase [Myxococcota bacterium]